MNIPWSALNRLGGCVQMEDTGHLININVTLQHQEEIEIKTTIRRHLLTHDLL